MKNFLFLSAIIFSGSLPTYANEKTILSLRTRIEQDIVDKMTKDGVSDTTETEIEAALFLTIKDLGRGMPKVGPVIIKMLQDENRKNIP